VDRLRGLKGVRDEIIPRSALLRQTADAATSALGRRAVPTPFLTIHRPHERYVSCLAPRRQMAGDGDNSRTEHGQAGPRSRTRPRGHGPLTRPYYQRYGRAAERGRRSEFGFCRPARNRPLKSPICQSWGPEPG